MAPSYDTAMMEDLSRAYVRAVTVRAGCRYRDALERDIGTDAQIDYIDRLDGKLRDTGLQLRLQIKATTRESQHTPTEIVRDLEVDHYRKLIARSPGVRIVLIVFDMPNDVDRWLHTAPEELIIRKCAYWSSLEGKEDVINKATVRVKIPKAQRFDVDAVRVALRSVASKEDIVSDERRARQRERSDRSLPMVGRRPLP